MAGLNKVVKAGTVLFRNGDKSNGMYVIRKGELSVYLDKDGKQVTLATLPEGSIVGEMAFFDSQPRSASVKATKDSEITVISNDDFAKLLKQIPKWFVSLMQALSGRLRDTNGRLQKLEGMKSGSSGPYQSVLRFLRMLNLVWSRDGAKGDKGTQVARDGSLKLIAELTGDASDAPKKMIAALVGARFFSETKDSYGVINISIANKGVLDRFIEFVQTWATANPKLPSLSADALKMLEIAAKSVQASAYESITMSFDDLQTAGQEAQLDVSTWSDHLGEFKSAGDACQLVKSTGAVMALKVDKKGIAQTLMFHRVLATIANQGLT